MKKQSSLRIPARQEVAQADKWDLTSLYAAEEDWEEDFKLYSRIFPEIETFKGKLAQSPEQLRKACDFFMELEKREERLSCYAQLRVAEDLGSSKNQDRQARLIAVAVQAAALASYWVPEIQSIPDETMNAFLQSETLAPYLISLKKILRSKPHVLPANEERLLTLQTETNRTARKAFSALTNVDMDFGHIETPEGKQPLTQSTFSALLRHQEQGVRKQTYLQLYGNFNSHRHTLVELYAGKVHLDVYHARIRHHPSALAAALFADDVPDDVYTNLIATVHSNLDKLHRYYRIRRQALGLERLYHYDVYVPLIKDVHISHTYEQAVEMIAKALDPLGEDYTTRLSKGLLNGWVDRYENKGKRAGAFSAGSYTGDPYILLNYKEDVLDDVFTLAHEGGHSMHSWYSARYNPFQHYGYTIFEAEVASTFNEQLLGRYLLEHAESREMKAYLVLKEIDSIIGTIYRQTMFAEFEKITHEMVEANQPLTVDSVRAVYRKLLEQYFGSEVALEELSDLECFRIPHFYNAFYVYKYATGLSAAIALAGNVLKGGATEREQYLSFLKSGGSRFPLESLKLAGIDMGRPEPVEQALALFSELVQQLQDLIIQ